MAEPEAPRRLAFLTDGDLFYLDMTLEYVRGLLPDVLVAVEAELQARALTHERYVNTTMPKILEALGIGQAAPKEVEP